MPVLAIANQKGGVGKTATTHNLGHVLSLAGKRVCLIDFDPQANLTTCCGFSAPDVGLSIADVMTGEIRSLHTPLLIKVLITTAFGVSLAPATEDLSGTEPDLYAAMGGELVLRHCLVSQRQAFDFILIDCPPNLGLLTINALAAADGVLVPVEAEFLAMKGVGQLVKTVSVVKQRINPQVVITGLLITKADRTVISRDVLRATRNAATEYLPVFDSVIRRRVEIRESQRSGKTILQYSRNSDSADDYLRLGEELLSREQKT